MAGWRGDSPGHASATASSRPRCDADLAIATVLMIKRVFHLILRAAQDFMESILS
ncbi:hypothetical protein DBV23_03490 [Edwardsiella ictaluri]|nr:hypothetical protein DBV23_03490 [Edwardsiella ictaluri]EKS7764256.1 transposase [Edwardsiella ictaluri]EKS7771114.1 transposase [Edwardsiella ictaluri]EKS7777540.1 transposase [Edwardsiella ictaluri]EKS7787678.1 transposase [Edwardsiella ictaluri]